VRSLALAKRNLSEAARDPLSLGLAVAMPTVLFVILQALKDLDAIFTPASLAPGIVLFGYAMITFSAAMTLGQDRETDLFARLLTAPLRSNDFVASYSLPYLALAIFQAAVIFVIGGFLGLESEGNLGLVVLVLAIMAIWYVGMGMVLGSLVPYKAVSSVWAAILLLTIFGGAWFDLGAFPGAFQAVGNALPFAHAIDAGRAVMVDGADLGDIATDLAWMGGHTLAVVLLAVAVFHRRMHE
jgi:ABC-2 type transport system permease protein